MLNLPESSISVSMRKRLSGLKEAISHHIVGQTAAIDKVVANVVASKLNLDVKNNRPDGVFLFIGPTGVGKTETAIALAKALYGSEDYLIRIDMSEYMERFTYSRFIGAAPGYVGYYDANQLTDKVRQNPFSVILLDEFEKADIQLINIFLQVFDAGRLTDARGNVVDFSHTTIIMTSNIGTSLFSKSQMGYQSSFTSGAVSRGDLIKALKRHFSPEFLNRIDEIVIFDPLGEEDIRNIIEVQLRGIRAGLGKQGKELVVGDDVFRYIIDHYHSKEYGARNVSRALKTELLQKVAHLSLQDDWDEAKCVACGVREDSIEVRLVSECLGEAPDGRQVMARNKSEGYE
jgi:ATP-dependent Clp protease ATP-binding subunit ClpA